METRPSITFDKESIRFFIPPDGYPAVYRIYDEAGLLYVGATMQPRTRLLAHLRNPLLVSGKRVEIERCKTSTEMARKERRANLAESPFVVTNGRRHAAWKAQPKRSRA